jgi:hypothetical protein
MTRLWLRPCIKQPRKNQTEDFTFLQSYIFIDLTPVLRREVRGLQLHAARMQ